ncbi:hypothetical protein DICPUDRAFT_47917 [Dictyostelium purpureum]|uniref:alpha-mannosidase n=1 Tax=Dictyostelium purpureum TaxID=5786 RepID=F0ZLY3_DICPU|nr:uncharacterized protein DICPUDRAFT_47917 [Dictyostelium purpureum]EGC35047.1 hypothetical protein DICPUDRAFT_47917 [Dictyostelium purpureum]|eukprot:XP_003288415.1 hypothetical protein DICPUDRAFT_47917 [Dictyostelium purpureum]
MKLFYIGILLLGLIINTFANVQEGKVKIHLVCHSHCDSGWTSTFEEYYAGQVRSIISTMVTALNKETNPPRKFVWSEIGFLERWWDVVPQNLKDDFTRHVKDDRIEFINGGWVMNDEACPSIDSVIRQLSNGHKFIQEHFGKKPENGWQIDPFGHSSFTPTIQAQMGYKHVVLNRIHYTLKNKFKQDKNLQFLWRGSPEGLGPKSDILAHVFDDFYTSPPHLNFDGYNFQSYGLPRLCSELAQLGVNRSAFYQSPHVLIPIGGDFNYRNAERAYDQMDKVVQCVNEKFNSGQSNVEVVYSTLKEFFNETVQWHNENKVKFNYYDSDFFPYADDANTYWTGYYTSRPLLKGYERFVSSKLRAAEIFSSFQNVENFYNQLLNASKQVSIIQHHDAITGTSKKHVVQDYITRLSKADDIVSSASAKSVANSLNPKNPDTLSIVDLSKPLVFNTDQQQVPFVIMNSLSWDKNELVTVKVQTNDPNANGGSICPYVLAEENSNFVIEMDCSPRSDYNLENNIEYIQIDFPIEIKPFSSKKYILRRNVEGNTLSNWVRPTTTIIPSIQNHLFKINLNERYFAKSCFNFKENSLQNLNQELLTYSDIGGAYIFRTSKKIFEPERRVYSSIAYIGKFYQEAQSVIQDRVENRGMYGVNYGLTTSLTFNTIRLLNTGNEQLDSKIQFTLHVKGVNGTTTVNKFSTDIDNNRDIYSDNGLELIYRPSDTTEPPAIGKETQSYYPSNHISLIKSKKTGLNFVCNHDRTRGISSQCNGCLEFAIHRSLTWEDSKGLEVPAIDESPINAHFECYFTHDHSDDVRVSSLNYDHKIAIYQGVNEEKLRSVSFLNKKLPNYIHILTLERPTSKSIKFRVQNLQEPGNSPIQIDLNGLFTFIKKIKSVKEYNLSLVNPFEDNNIDNIQTSYKSIVGGKIHPVVDEPKRYNPMDTKNAKLQLNPLEIKAIEIKF